MGVTTTRRNHTRACLASLVGLALLAPMAHADGIAGHWEGAVVRLNSIQTIVLDITRASDATLSGTYDIPDLLLFGEPLDSLRFAAPDLRFHMRYGTFTARLDSADAELTGQNPDWGPPVAIHLKRMPMPAPTYTAHEVRFTNAGDTLAGTVYVPATTGKHAGVVLVHGSGSGGRVSFEYRGLGVLLAKHRVASLVYDKRGTGRSGGDLDRATFDQLAGDAASAATLLASRPDIDRRRVGLLGTSQGGWLAPLAAAKSPAVRFLILDKGPAVSVEEQELDRVEYSMRQENFSANDIADAVAYTRAVFRAAYDGAGLEGLSAMTARARATKWADQVQLADSSDLEGWRAQRYDPTPVLRRTRVPVLAIFGEQDVFVPPAENLARMREALAAAGNRDTTIVVLAGEGHNRYLGAGLVGNKWAWPNAFWRWDKVSPRYQETILGWLAGRGASGGATAGKGAPTP